MAVRKKSSAVDGDVPASFADGLAALEGLVGELEAGELPLEKALESFERGVRLVRQLNERLNEAEKKIEILSRGPGGQLVVEAMEVPGADVAATAEDDGQ